MKTKELIKKLQEADPTGEVECCVENKDIYFLNQEGAYYDGPLEVLIHDESKKDKEWSVIGAKITRVGGKVQIRTLSIEDLIYDKVYQNKDFPVTIEGDSVDGRYQKRVEQWKEEAKNAYKKYKENEQVNNTN